MIGLQRGGTAVRAIHRRFRFLAVLWREGIWGRWAAAAWGAYGVFAAFRDEILSNYEDRLKVLSLVPNLSGTLWCTVAVLVMTVWLFEASYRVHVKTGDRIEALEAEMERVASEQSGVVIGIADHRELWSDKRDPRNAGSIKAGDLTWSWLVSVRNTADQMLTNCQLFTAIAPIDRPGLIRGEASPVFTLRRDEDVSLGVVMEKHDHQKSQLQLERYYKVDGEWRRAFNQPWLPIKDYLLRAELVSAEAPKSTAYFRLSHDGSHWVMRPVEGALLQPKDLHAHSG